MTIKLRPHHLLFMLTYVGKEYSPVFVEICHRIAKRITDGEDIVVVKGPDGICAPLLDKRDAHCYQAGVRDRDRQAAGDVGDLLGTVIAPGVLIHADPVLLVRALRDSRQGWIWNGAGP
ncbi:DUF1284 domain-containing protein [Falsirhodobacter sp. 1013]|uniref:DUF1284 domain-containing protein n=1 Tax=Falsirhodobacter sp. 1013 TaxID=3417566 RepID=UPI003EB7AA59